MIDIKCPKCSRVFHVKEDFRGAVVECGSCSVMFEVPTSGSVGVVTNAVPNISVVCPGCRTTHQVPGNARGLEAECMVCKRSFRIPEQDAPPGVAAPATATLRPATPTQPAKATDFGDTSTIRLTRSTAKFRDNTMAPVPPADASKPTAPAAAVPMSTPVPQQFPPPAPAPTPAPAAAPAPPPRPAAPVPAPRAAAALSPPPPPAVAKPAATIARRESEQSQRVLGRISGFHLEADEEILDSKEATTSDRKRNRFLFLLPVAVIWCVAFLSWALGTWIFPRMSWIFPLMFSVIGTLFWMLLAAGPLLGARNRLWLVVTDKRVVMGSGKDTLTINRTG